jgi:hypothetical protein
MAYQPNEQGEKISMKPFETKEYFSTIPLKLI